MPRPIDIARYVAAFFIGLIWAVFVGPATKAEAQKYIDEWLEVGA